jgi:hypothetical protein
MGATDPAKAALLGLIAYFFDGLVPSATLPRFVGKIRQIVHPVFWFQTYRVDYVG